MKKKQIRTLYSRALSLALVVSTTASLCLGISGVTAAMEEQKHSEDMKQKEEEMIGERHYHTFACYEEYELNCQEEHEENEHREGCYRYSGERICGLEDGELHFHSSECEVAAEVLICEELEGNEKENRVETEDLSVDEKSEEEDAGESEITGEESFSEEVSGEGSISEEASGEGSIGEEPSGEESFSEEASGEESVAEEASGEGSIGEEPSGEESVSGEELSGEESVAEEASGEESIGEETSGEGSISEEPSEESDNAEIVETETVEKEMGGGENFDEDMIKEETIREDTMGEEISREEVPKGDTLGNENTEEETDTAGNNEDIDKNKEHSEITKSDRGRFSLHAVLFDEDATVDDELIADNDSIESSDAARSSDMIESGETAESGDLENKAKPMEVPGERSDEIIEGHQHTEACYKTIYRCRQGAAKKALREGGVTNEEELRNALKADGEEIMISIGKDFSITDTVEISGEKNVIIDLQGHTITYNGAGTAASMFRINAAVLTIKDSANTQQSAKKISEKIVSEAGTAAYDSNTGRLTYYVTECTVNLDGKSTTNRVKEYVYDLGASDTVGTLKSNGLNTLILIEEGVNGKLIVEGGRITNEGGKHGIYVKEETHGIVVINGGYLMNNGREFNDEYGGAIFMESGTLTIGGGVIAKNTGKAGGGVYAKGSNSVRMTVNITGGIIAANHSVHAGGGIYGNNATVKIGGSAKIIANSAGSDGGGVMSYGSESVLEFTSGCLAGNTAKDGGGVYLQDSSKSNCIGTGANLVNNRVDNCGGGVYLRNVKVNFNGVKIVANTALADGGGVYVGGANDEIESSDNSIIALNQSKDNGSNSVFPADKINDLKGKDSYIEGALAAGLEVEVASYERLKEEIEGAGLDGQDKNKVIIVKQPIEMMEPVEVSHGAAITLILNGNDIQGQKVSGGCLFSVNGKGSSLTIRNMPLGENEWTGKEERPVSADQAGKQGEWNKENHTLTYYVTKSNPNPGDETQTIEETYEVKLCFQSGNYPVGTIQGTGKEAVLSGKNEGILVIEGGIIAGAEHGVKLESNAAMVMRGGAILGCGSEGGSADLLIPTDEEDSGNSPENGAGIYADGAAGIQIFDGVIAGNVTPKRGGGIFSNAGKVEFRGGVIAANIAGNIGGGICAQGGSTVLIGDDRKEETMDLASLVISGNTAKAIERPSDEREAHRKSRHYGGGGIFSDSDSRLFILHHAFITNNRAEGIPGQGSEGIQDGAGLGGGGIFSCGKIQMSGSYITANYSEASGGGIFSYSGKLDKINGGYSGQLILTGGIVAGNTAVHNEGGGVRIDQKGEIKSENGNKIYITNNRTHTITNWGGGGLFNTSGADTTIQNVLITNNTAAGFGGGIAGCNHGTNQFFVNHGAGIFDNLARGNSEKLQGDTFPGFSKNEKKNDADRIDIRTPVIQDGDVEGGSDTFFMDYKNEDSLPSYQDFYCSNISQVYGSMLGGGNANWRGSGSNSSKEDKSPTAFPVKVSGEDYVETSNLMGLTAHPSDEDKNKAKSNAEIYITGNQSAAHGAGVMTNGRFVIGVSAVGKVGTLTIEKKLQDMDGKEISGDTHRKFTFLIYLMDTEGAPLKGSYSYEKSPMDAVLDGNDGNGKIEAMPARITLRAGQRVTISGLPNGSYQITEEEDENSPYEAQNKNNIKQGVIWEDDGRGVVFINVPKPVEPTHPEESEEPTEPEESSRPDEPSEPEKPSDSESPGTSEDPGSPEVPSTPEDSTTPENPESTSAPDNPAATSSPGGGGGRHDSGEPATTPPSTTTASSETVPVTFTEPGTESLPAQTTPFESSAENPGFGVPQYPVELPDPNAPGSPDSITIMEDDVPRTYIKVWDPETEEFVYLPEDEVPLASMLPQTGDPFKEDVWRIMFIFSLISTAVLLCLNIMEKRRI